MELIIKSVPQLLVLGPLLFNIYLNDLYCLPEYTDICDFVDDIPFHACDKDLNSLINRLEHDSLLVIEWFENNNMKLNQGKCHLIVSGHKYENEFVSVGQLIIWETESRKLLGNVIDRKLNFNDYVTSISKKPGKTICVKLGKTICVSWVVLLHEY